MTTFLDRPDIRSMETLLAELSQDEREQALDGLDAEALTWSWQYKGRKDQLEATNSDAPTILYVGGRGAGKALDLDTPIPTPSGWKLMGDLKTGEEVFGSDGSIVRIVRAHPVLLDRECVTVEFSDGTEVICDAEHLWSTWDKPARKNAGRGLPGWGPGIRTSAEIGRTLRHSTREINHSVVVASAVQYPEQYLSLDPWVLGIWLGDGSFTGRGWGASLCLGDDDAKWVLAELATRGFEASSSRQELDYYTGEERHARTYQIRGLGAALRSIGIGADKRVPEAYLRGSELQRRDLLAGLLDSDGDVARRGSVGFISVRPWLADTVAELAISLGYIVGRGTKMVTPKATWNPTHKEYGPYYLVRFTPREQVFKSRASAAQSGEDQAYVGALRRIEEIRGQLNRVRHRYIVAVTPVETRPVRCITVDAPDSLYLCSRSMIPTHNTRAGSEWVRDKIERKPKGMKLRFALVSRTTADVRDTIIGGDSGLMSVFPPHQRPVYIGHLRTIRFYDGSEGLCFSSNEPDQLRGPQFQAGYADELAAWDFTPDVSGLTAWDNLQIATRLGDNPQIYASTTPRRIPAVRELYRRAKAGLGVKLVTGASTYDNPYLSNAYLNTMTGLYEGTRLSQQELYGVLLGDIEGALWQLDDLDSARVDTAPFDLPMIVVGVDPSVAENPKDECGIVVACATGGTVLKRHAYVLADRSVHGPPKVWAKAVVKAARDFHAPIVAERNQGGALIKEAIHTIDPTLRVKTVWAKKGKLLRAEPVTLVYDQHRVHHVGRFPQLEDQMCSWVQDRKSNSPDRLDALVYALSALVVPSSYKSGVGSPTVKSAANKKLPAARATQFTSRPEYQR